MLRSIRLRNLLSFGPDSEAFPLRALNVLIGPNASGKSNLIEALGLLRATPGNLLAPIREGGGVTEWLWKGGTEPGPPTAKLEVVLDHPEGVMPLSYQLAFTVEGQRLSLVDELLTNERSDDNDPQPMHFYQFNGGAPVLTVRADLATRPGASKGRQFRRLTKGSLSSEASVFSQRRDMDVYPELTFAGTRFGLISLHREWNLGRYTPPRLPQRTDLPGDFLLEDASNLGLVLNDLEFRPGVKKTLLENLRLLYARVEDFSVRISGGTVQVYFLEEGLSTPIPATRLSDGTLRYLCLLTLLCHPTPPPLICIEEPELGLHPDILPVIGRLLREASTRTQLIVTTHSDTLVSALSEEPESVVVCEQEQGGTVLRRLEKEKLSEWLSRYSLGEVWRMGELGGTRW
ncbi:AAA family ATPase [Corallococcus exiguus]|uniref:AAA family ATPase n=1 Tax=Corallococcus TaxID=83461 RepID=UPI000EBE6244|nr:MULTISPECIES: AAA family ATPase [Corallococcus]NNC18779.1 AAA family ATPase [Corallococcus exiguus]RKI11721.1 chromosome segregation protein SMC [Corallococcus sp. AB030]